MPIKSTKPTQVFVNGTFLGETNTPLSEVPPFNPSDIVIDERAKEEVSFIESVLKVRLTASQRRTMHLMAMFDNERYEQ